MNPGTRLGPYEIVSLLGAGGMGEVYRARDSRLQRDVAIKVLPASFVHDATRRARFERETRAVAALSHTNILAIFDTGVHDGHVFAVTELLDGDTLRARLDSGPLPVKKAIDIGTQVARGLSAAHEKGIVHRDLKPENVFLLRDGQVKILDFGLATTSTSSSSSGANATVTAMTVPGTVMGTVGYMAPEQVRGLTLDARTDLFALGAVLYEMLTGTRAFRGKTPADVASAILREEPPEMASLRNDLPPALEPIVRHCLERTPADRFQSAHDVAFALATLSGSTVAATTPQPTPVRRVTPSTMTVAAACVAGGVLAGVLITMAASRGRAAVPPPAAERRPAPVLRTAINLPAAAPLAIGSSLTQVGFDNPAVALSPDGTYLAYVSRSGQSTALSLVELKTGQVRTLPGTEGATHSFFSPDSQQLGFLTLDRVKRVAVQGGATRTLCEALRPSVARWTADNVVYFSERWLCGVACRRRRWTSGAAQDPGGRVRQRLHARRQVDSRHRKNRHQHRPREGHGREPLHRRGHDGGSVRVRGTTRRARLSALRPRGIALRRARRRQPQSSHRRPRPHCGRSSHGLAGCPSARDRLGRRTAGVRIRRQRRDRQADVGEPGRSRRASGPGPASVRRAGARARRAPVCGAGRRRGGPHLDSEPGPPRWSQARQPGECRVAGVESRRSPHRGEGVARRAGPRARIN